MWVIFPPLLPHCRREHGWVWGALTQSSLIFFLSICRLMWSKLQSLSSTWQFREVNKRKDQLFHPCTSLQMFLMTAVDVQPAHSNRIITLRLPVFITIAWPRGRFYSSGRRYIIYKLETIEGALYYKRESLPLKTKLWIMNEHLI